MLFKQMAKVFCSVFGTLDTLFDTLKRETDPALVDRLHFADFIEVDEIGAVNP